MAKQQRDHRAEHLKRSYGMTEADYNTLLTRQHGKCAVCRRYRRLVVDHCHTRNTVRGLLCNSCNSLIGFAEENPAILHNAVAYLKRTGE